MIHYIPRCHVEGQMGRDSAARGVTSRVVADSSAGNLFICCWYLYVYIIYTQGFGVPLPYIQDVSTSTTAPRSNDKHLHLQVGGVAYRLSI